MNLVKSFASDQQGAAAIQYAFVAAILGLAVLSSSLMLQGSIIDLYDGMAVRANTALAAKATPPPFSD